MSRSRPPLSPDVLALLDQERAVPPVPASVRTRTLARARAALLAGRVAAADDFARPRRIRWGNSMALTCAAMVVVGAAAAAVAYQYGAHRQPAAADRPGPAATHVVTPSPTPPASTPTVGVVPPPATPTPAPASRAPNSSHAAPGPDELRLLRQARAAVARQDFAAALAPIAEHARRFKGGRLVEEREALRVRALAGLGRTEEARRAAEAFKARFPRSVLLPAVSQMPASGP